MAQDLLPKLKNIAGDATVQARNFLQALQTLLHDSHLLEQSGGNFPVDCFDNTNLSYLTEEQANVFLQTVIPDIETFLDTHVGGDVANPTYRESFQVMVSSSY